MDAKWYLELNVFNLKGQILFGVLVKKFFTKFQYNKNFFLIYLGFSFKYYGSTQNNGFVRGKFKRLIVICKKFGKYRNMQEG